MTRVKISEFKARLSEYIRRAQNGEEIIVCDRENPIGVFQVFEDTMVNPDIKVRPPLIPDLDFTKIKRTKPKKKIDVLKALADTRGDRF